MKRRARNCIAVVVYMLVLPIAGCASIQKQVFNKDANQSLKTIGILEQADTEKYFVQNMGHVGMAFGAAGGLVAAIDMEVKANQFTALMKDRNLKVVDESQDWLKTELENLGYSVKMLKPIRKKHALLEKYDGLDSEVDAYLDFTVGAGYICAVVTADYIPAVHFVVRMVKRGSNEILYQEVIYYGYKLFEKDAACITADQQYHFKGFGAICVNPDRAMEGLRRGVSLVAVHIGKSLAK